MKEIQVNSKEIDAMMDQLTKIRDPQNPPTRSEVEEIICRMKRRWLSLVQDFDNN